MMTMLEEAIIYATVMHQGKKRKLQNRAFILHPMEVAQVLSTMTDDEEVITAGILHDIVEDTDGTLAEIESRFGKRVAFLVSSESEKEYPELDPAASWKLRKEDSLAVLKNSTDIGVKMLWLADKLTNIRSLAGEYSEKGEEIWKHLHQNDPAMQCWYYRSIAEIVELSLNKTGAFKEYIKHINFIWPGTFDSEKARYKKYKEVSVDGCKIIGRGAKGEVYRYDDELIIKVYNQKNTYRDVEREIALSRKAFILGIPTAISFGIVAVGDSYGAMFELVESETISACISRAPGQTENYAKVMADLAREIHSIEASEDDSFPEAAERIREYIRGGIAHVDEALAEKCMKLVDGLPASDNLVHGDFHTGNVFMQNGEPLLIDMDRISRGDPIIEISDLYYFYVMLGENDASVVEKFMAFPYEDAKRFFDSFLKHYLGTDDEKKLGETIKKASLICCIRMINKLHKKGCISEQERRLIDHYMHELSERLNEIDSLAL